MWRHLDELRYAVVQGLLQKNEHGRKKEQKKRMRDRKKWVTNMEGKKEGIKKIYKNKEV
jgi:hypothetical protein